MLQRQIFKEIVMNEILLVFSLTFTYGSVLLAYKYLGKSGLYVWTAIATIIANIEVMLLIQAFGIEQTLGNILFASTFLVTDILAENEGKASAKKAVCFGILANLVFIVVSRTWLMYIPSANDWASPAMRDIFANVPRIMIVGIVVYALSQVFDVWLYDKIWKITTKVFNNSERGLWIRNNVSTLISQAINIVLFTFGAFYGLENYDIPIIWTLILSSYLVYLVTSVCDTPIVYLARKMHKNKA